MGTRARVTVREARNEELPVIRQLAIKGLEDELDEDERAHLDESRAMFTRKMDGFLQQGGNEIFVATVEGDSAMAGYLWFGVGDRPFSSKKVGWVYDIQVMPAYRGKGVGEALMRHALEVSRKRGFPQTGLMVRANNRVAYSLYEKLGFAPERVLMRRDGSQD